MPTQYGGLILLAVIAGCWWWFGRKPLKVTNRQDGAAPAEEPVTVAPPNSPKLAAAFRKQSLAEAVANARTIAREEWERRDAARDEETGLEAAKARVARMEAYLRKADAEDVLSRFLSATQYWSSWCTHETKPLAYLEEHGISVSDGSSASESNGKKRYSFSLRMAERTYRVEVSLGYAYWSDEGGDCGTLTVHVEGAEEPRLVIGVTRKSNEWGSDWSASLYGLEACRGVEWLPDFALVGELVDAHDKARMRELDRKRTLEKAAGIIDPPV